MKLFVNIAEIGKAGSPKPESRKPRQARRPKAELASAHERPPEWSAGFSPLHRQIGPKAILPSELPPVLTLKRRERRAPVAQTSKSAVSQVSKPGRLSLFEPRPVSPRPADLEVGDTAGLETCATPSAFGFRFSSFIRHSSFVIRHSLCLLVLLFTTHLAFSEARFPPPEFSETNHQLPGTTVPPARAEWLSYLDTGVLLACLGVALYFIYRQRSRRGLFWLSLFSLAYFGFWRKGCICPIGAPQNVVYALFNPGYSVPLTVLIFCFAPLVVALFAGRAFCAGVCPQGALQDLVLIKPLKVPSWLEHALGLVPFLFLGFGLAFAATGTGFPICRYDPLVPVFRLSGSFFIMSAAVIVLLLGMFVGRPYCRFLCPYGALLRLASLLSKWRVRVTPDYCTQCRLCETACPFNVIREPTPPDAPQTLAPDRRRLGGLLALLPVLIAAGVGLGAAISPAVARLNPTVALAERYVRQQKDPVNFGVMTPETLGLQRAEQNPEAIITAAADFQKRFHLAMLLFGGWAGLVIGVKLIALSVRTRRTDWEPDRGGCFACARCFRSCPNERVRLGLMPASELPAMPAAQKTP